MHFLRRQGKINIFLMRILYLRNSFFSGMITLSSFLNTETEMSLKNEALLTPRHWTYSEDKKSSHLFLPVEMLYTQLRKESLWLIFMLVCSDAVKPVALCRNRESHSGHSNPFSTVHLPFVPETKSVSLIISCLQGWALISSLCSCPEMWICSFLPLFAIKNTV